MHFYILNCTFNETGVQSEFPFSCVVNSQSFFASTPTTIRFTLFSVELEFEINEFLSQYKLSVT